MNSCFWISPFFYSSSSFLYLFLHTPSHPKLIYGRAREQSNPMTIVLYDKLLQAVRPIVLLVGPRVPTILRSLYGIVTLSSPISDAAQTYNSSPLSLQQAHGWTVLCSLRPNYLQFGVITTPPWSSSLLLLELSNQSAIVQLLIATSRLLTTHVQLRNKLTFERQNLKTRAPLVFLTQAFIVQHIHKHPAPYKVLRLVCPEVNSIYQLLPVALSYCLWPSCNSSPRLEPSCRHNTKEMWACHIWTWSIEFFLLFASRPHVLHRFLLLPMIYMVRQFGNGQRNISRTKFPTLGCFQNFVRVHKALLK